MGNTPQPQPDPGRKQLLARAAHCYRGAGLMDDACRCLERADSYHAAATLHEEAGRWEPAAHCFERIGQWPQAARCYLRAGLPTDSARCHLAGNNPLTGAWILAHHAHRFDCARAALAHVTPEGPWQELALLLAEARCELPRRPRQAERALGRLFVRLRELGPEPPASAPEPADAPKREPVPEDDPAPDRDAGASGEQNPLAQTAPSPNREPNPERDRVMNWGYTLAWRVMDRPDLTTELFAAAWEAGIDTRGHWEDWLGQRLGDATGPEFLPESK
ncbi:MAG: hypothetical protein BECKG1743D_GA0114223_105604 [Candidatus Kentron sp. G]|nr:MAG: hypothetical protein BECKG1743F_GA0114225_106692 [Candidatus Kentron sp. G]VFN03951.1 MAG: hypothetical protein BECKG1743E_GA0114224_106753 [Candidatus Kentron sp. G]VFN04219.1 MAG: hypothetical protein BECKG1743D_GA0114223_105604 [Candidatus Kentron sp. G]